MAPKFWAEPQLFIESTYTYNVKHSFLAVWAPRSELLVFIPDSWGKGENHIYSTYEGRRIYLDCWDPGSRYYTYCN